MANATWKKFEKSHGFRKAKLFVKRLTGRELRLKPAVDIDTVECCDWWFNADALPDDAVVYSLGIGEEIDFDLQLIAIFGARIFAFDPTPNTQSWIQRQSLPDDFNFYPWAVAARDGILKLYPRRKKDGTKSRDMFTMLPAAGAVDDAVEVPAYCIGSIQEKLGHGHIDLLKMDIEGAEYEVLDGLIGSNTRPTQLLIEFHHRFPGIGKEKTAHVIGRLERIGYKIFAVSITGREISLIRPAA